MYANQAHEGWQGIAAVRHRVECHPKVVLRDLCRRGHVRFHAWRVGGRENAGRRRQLRRASALLERRSDREVESPEPNLIATTFVLPDLVPLSRHQNG